MQLVVFPGNFILKVLEKFRSNKILNLNLFNTVKVFYLTKTIFGVLLS